METLLSDESTKTKKERQKKLARATCLFFKCNAHLLSYHYFKYIHKVSCYDSAFTGYMWMKQILYHENGVRCTNALRMETHVFENLCTQLEMNYGLCPSRNMSVMEKVGIFIYTLALGVSNRDVCERFQRSGDTISRVFHQVLDAITGRNKGFDGLARRMLHARDPTFASIPEKINSERRYSLFKGAIGCIDGTHIDACIPLSEQIPYRSRKGMTSFNVMAVCDFDMYFTFISAGWEGSAHDARVLDHALSTPEMNFPHPPPGKYYLVDKGYPDRCGYMVPYSNIKYHPSQFHNHIPQNSREVFNKVHSSLRTTIERCFGVLKKRWKILTRMPSYQISTQVDIILSCFALHNFILAYKNHDAFLEGDEEVEVGPMSTEEGEDGIPGGMGHIRDTIVAALWNNRRFYYV